MTLTATSPWSAIVELPENRLALQAVLRLGRGVAAPFHPLVLHGPSGTGKSLLAAALVRRVIRGPSVRTALTVPARELGFNGDIEFADLRNADLLVIEDVQLTAANAVPLLTRVLDERGRRRRGTLLTANAGPAQLKKLPPRLTSRLAGGLVIALEPFSAASRKAILQRHLETKRISLDPAALDWLASRPGGIRPLLGILDTLQATNRGRAEAITMEQVRPLMDEEPVGVERIVQRVARAYGVNARELLGPSRLRNVLLPRQVAMFLARDVAMLPLPRIGEHFGGRDHSTVQHAVNKIRIALADDRQLAGTIRQLKLELS